jgi:hypothetical protein
MKRAFRDARRQIKMEVDRSHLLVASLEAAKA